MKRVLFFLTFVSITILSFPQEKTTMTDSLTKQWNTAWNNKDVNALIKQLQPNAIFEFDPYEIHITRDSIAATIFKIQLNSMHNLKSTEIHTLKHNNIAWSIGNMSGIWSNGQRWKGTYTFEFTRKPGQNWKIQMLITYDK
jgi:ketosteroid isomerase-like protein